MYLCFVDESGSVPRNALDRPNYFVIAGLIIPEEQWADIAAEVQEIKDRKQFKVRGEIKWRYFGLQNDDPRNTVSHLFPKDRDLFRTQIFRALTKRKSVRIVACVASAAAAYGNGYVTNADDLYEFTYKPVTERFQYFLQDLERDSGRKAYGMVIADHRDKKQDQRLRRHHNKLLFSKSPVISRYDNLIEGLFLTQSHGSVGIQLADMVAGAIGRYFNSQDSAFLDQIKGSFRLNPKTGSYEGHGLAKFPRYGWK